MNSEKSINRFLIDWPLMILAFVCTLVLFLPFTHVDIDTYHDGIMLKPILDLLAGQKLYVDTFSQYGPLTNLIFYFFAKIFGPGLLVMKTVTVFFYAVAASIFIGTWRLFLPRQLAILSFLIWLIFPPFYENDWALLPWASVIALPFQALSFLIFAKNTQDRRAYNYLLTGIFVGITVWSRQSVGASLFLALLFVLAVMWLKKACSVKFQSLVLYCLGFFITTLCVFSYLFYNHLVADWYAQNVVFVTGWTIVHSTRGFLHQHFLIWFREWDHGLVVFLFFLFTLIPAFLSSNFKYKQRLSIGVAFIIFYFLLFQHGFGAILFKNFRTGFQAIIPFVTATSLVYFLYRILISKKELAAEHYLGLIASAVSIASVLQYFPGPDYRHVYWGITPIFGLLTFVYWKSAKYHPTYVTVIVSLLFFPLAEKRAIEATVKLAQKRTELTLPLSVKGIRVKPMLAEEIGKLAAKINHLQELSISKKLVTFTPDAFFSTFSQNLANPGPFFVSWGYGPNDQVRENERRIEFVQKNRPLVIFTNTIESAVSDFEKKWNYSVRLNSPTFSLQLLAPNEVSAD